MYLDGARLGLLEGHYNESLCCIKILLLKVRIEL